MRADAVRATKSTMKVWMGQGVWLFLSHRMSQRCQALLTHLQRHLHPGAVEILPAGLLVGADVEPGLAADDGLVAVAVAPGTLDVLVVGVDAGAFDLGFGTLLWLLREPQACRVMGNAFQVCRTAAKCR